MNQLFVINVFVNIYKNTVATSPPPSPGRIYPNNTRLVYYIRINKDNTLYKSNKNKNYTVISKEAQKYLTNPIL